MDDNLDPDLSERGDMPIELWWKILESNPIKCIDCGKMNSRTPYFPKGRPCSCHGE